jgi:D-glycero-alpha-D-manno-heptose 1-phosphate guanylyltransferase
MDAIILAGGLGTRLQPVVSAVPKPLAPVAGRPFLDILLAQLHKFGCVRKVILAVGHKAQMIQARYQNAEDYGFDIEFSLEQSPLGTGGAVCQALSLTASEDVLVLNGDSYVEFELEALAAMHASNNASVTMVVVEVADTSRFGRVMLDLPRGRVIEFTEKGGASGRGFINAGCYLLAREAFEPVSFGASSFETDLLPQRISTTYALIATGKFIDIGVPESYAAAAEYLHQSDI